jgi:hypothetical protein
MSFELDPVKYGVLWNTVENNEKKLEEMSKKIDKLENSIEELVRLVNQSRGALWMGLSVLSVISGVIGFVGSYFSGK